MFLSLSHLISSHGSHIQQKGPAAEVGLLKHQAKIVIKSMEKEKGTEKNRAKSKTF